MVDNWVQRGLSSMKDFPRFLAKLKGLVKFLRSEMAVAEIIKCLERDGAHDVAEQLRRAKLVSFANWRWGTIGDVCEGLGGFLESFTASFDPTPLADQRDTTELKNVVSALSSPEWLALFKFVRWFAAWLTPLMEWIGGCPCHQRVDGGAKDCVRKGRRLREAFSHATRVLEAGLVEATAWGPEDYDGDANLWRECQGAVRYTCILAKEKLGYLNKVPYLLARLDEPGLRDQCL